ncbi:MAG: hypothetical protein ACK4UN_02870 [Limisphaerales bacterium]
MKWKIIVLGSAILLVLVAVAAFLLKLPDEGATAVFSEYRNGRDGDMYVVGRYSGFPNGWDIAFFHKNREGTWHGYYLAHESFPWSARLKPKDDSIVILERETEVAEYWPNSGEFRHNLQGVTYLRKDATNGFGPARWGLVDE